MHVVRIFYVLLYSLCLAGTSFGADCPSLAEAQSIKSKIGNVFDQINSMKKKMYA